MSIPTAAAALGMPLHTAVKYVAAAYIVFLAIILIYVSIMATRQRNAERELVELRRDLEHERAQREAEQEPQHVS
jgi:threonine/homoserine/homoserine lactone efflux protein